MSETPPLTPEVLVPRLGEYLVEKGLISQDDLQHALETQTILRTNNDTRQIGQLLIDLGLINQAQVDQAITEVVLQLRTALTDANTQLERRVQERTAELEKALEQLSTVNDLKANLVSNISHELRTPLTHLKGYLDLLSSGDFGALNEDQTNVLNIILRSADRLGSLIEDLILFSVSERDQIYLHVQPANMQELCKSVYNRTLPKAQDHQIDLQIELPAEPLCVDADYEKISWVLMQILDNALKFSASNGKVTLRAYQEGNFVHFQISDNGIGIDADHIQKIFEPFYQLDGSTTRKVGGTGLGLALARRIIEAHGSLIHVYSEMGKGSQFEFELKLHQD